MCQVWLTILIRFDPFCILPVAGVSGASLRSNFDCLGMSARQTPAVLNAGLSIGRARDVSDAAECSKHSKAESFEFGLRCYLLYNLHICTSQDVTGQVSVVFSCNMLERSVSESGSMVAGLLPELSNGHHQTSHPWHRRAAQI